MRAPGSPIRLHRTDLGISLAEVLVAITVLAVTMTIALVLYDGARRSFKVGDNLTEQQQVVRIAVEELSRRLLAAGYNHNPEGKADPPDEQIEAAYDTAIVIRADFDADDAAQSIDPEQALSANAALPAVSTGNDEIIGFVLAKPEADPSASDDQLTFDADVIPVPRDGVVETVIADAVDLVQDDPPYTLYRVRVDENAATMSREPMIDNVRSLRFTFYDGAGQVMPAPGGADDPAGEGRRLRGVIRRIGLEIEALTADPDPRWGLDGSDPNPKTSQYRKFRLAEDIRPRNLGLFGLRDLQADAIPPPPPPTPSLHAGHCGGFWIDWPPSAAQDGVTKYQVRYGLDPSDLTGVAFSVEPGVYVGGLDPSKEYTVALEAIDNAGNVSQPSAAAKGTPLNSNEPKIPDDLDVSLGIQGYVNMEWDPVLDNTEPVPSADPIAPALRDFAKYYVYRDTTAEFELAADKRIAETLAPKYDDHEVVNCQHYYYRVTAVDACGKEGKPTNAPVGYSAYTTAPEVPSHVQAFFDGPEVRVTWDPVQRDVQGKTIYIDNYHVCRTPPMVGSAPPPSAFTVCQDVWEGKTEFSEPLSLSSPNTVYYRVQAQDACINTSQMSEPAAQPTCTFAGTLNLLATKLGGLLYLQGNVNNGSGSYDLVTFRVSPPFGSSWEKELAPPSTAPPWFAQWPNPQPSGTASLTIDFEVAQTNGCSSTKSMFFQWNP